MEVFIIRHGNVTLEQTGGGLNFEIVASVTQPSSPTENMVWLKTDTEITSWAISASQPESPTEGMVWIMYTDEDSAEFNALSENALMIAIGDAAQYVDGEWKNVHLYRYANEEWLDWTAHIIKDGTTIYPSATVGMKWKADSTYGSNNPKITLGDGFIQVNGSNTGYGMAYFGEFDLTGRTQIVLEGTFKVIESGHLYVWTSVGSYITETVVASAKYTATGATIDLSGNPLEGKHLIGIATQASYVQKITGLYVV